MNSSENLSEIEQDLFEEPYEEPANFVDTCKYFNKEQVSQLISMNVGIYKTDDEGLSPLQAAIALNKHANAGLLLDVYERDLEPLRGTIFKRALVAMPEDQTEEFWKHIEPELVDDCTPVLVKNNNRDTPKCVYLRNKLKHKSDDSMQLARKLKEKNGICDINWHSESHCGVTALHFALQNRMKRVVQRLLTMPTINTTLKNSLGETALHHALQYSDVDTVETITTDPEVFANDLYLLTYSTRNRKMQPIMEHVIKKMVESGKFTLKEILRMNIKQGQADSTCMLFHKIAFALQYDYFMTHTLHFDEEGFYVLTTNNENILNLLLQQNHIMKTYERVKIAKFLIKKYPKLVTNKTSAGFLMVHYAVMTCGDHGMVQMIHKKMIEVTGNENVFYDDMESAVNCLDGDPIFYTPPFSDIDSLLQKLFNGKWLEVLEANKEKLLHRFVLRSLDNFRFLEFLLSHKDVHFDLSESYEGMNAYIRALNGITRCYNLDEGFAVFQRLCDYQPIKDFDAADSEGKTVFMYICQFTQDFELLKKIIKSNPNVVHTRTINGSTCMHFIHQNLVKDSSGETVDKILLDCSADPTIVNSLGEKPISQAITAYNEVMFMTLLPYEKDEDINRRYGPQNEPLILSAFGRTPTIFEKLLERNPDLSVADGDGNNFLHKMCTGYNFEAAIKHVEKNASAIDINAKNNSGDTALSNALLTRGIIGIIDGIFRIFHDKIDFDITNNRQETITHKLVSSVWFHRYIYLFEMFPVLHKVINSQINMRDENGETPLTLRLSDLHSKDFPNMEGLLSLLSLENLRENFHVFVKDVKYLAIIFEKHPNFFEIDRVNLLNSSVIHITCPKAFDLILTKVSRDDVMNVRVDSRNILHLVCEKRDDYFLVSIGRFLTNHQLTILSEQTDHEGMKPVELLSDDRKALLEIFLND